MSLVLHSFILGQPHRLRRFRRVIEHIVKQRERVWLTRPGDIYEHIEAPPTRAAAPTKDRYFRVKARQ